MIFVMSVCLLMENRKYDPFSVRRIVVKFLSPVFQLKQGRLSVASCTSIFFISCVPVKFNATFILGHNGSL